MRDLRKVDSKKSPFLDRLKSMDREQQDPMGLLYGGDRAQMTREVSRPNQGRASPVSRSSAMPSPGRGTAPTAPAGPPGAAPGGAAGGRDVSAMTPAEAYQAGLDDNLEESLQRADPEAKAAFTPENVDLTTQTLEASPLDQVFPEVVEVGEEPIKSRLYTDPVPSTRDVVERAGSGTPSPTPTPKPMTDRLRGAGGGGGAMPPGIGRGAPAMPRGGGSAMGGNRGSAPNSRSNINRLIGNRGAPSRAPMR